MAVLDLHCSAGFSLAAVSGGFSFLERAGFSLRWLVLLQGTGSTARGLQLLWHMGFLVSRLVNPPGPGIKPMSPALAGGLLTTGPPGKSSRHLLKAFYVWGSGNTMISKT